jgi:uncharacterized protein
VDFMQTSAPAGEGLEQGDPGIDPRLSRLRAVIEHAAHVLPAQGPITVFIHHNTLHAFEDLPFHDAVKEGARLYGCQPYLSEDRCRDKLRRGRIRFADLREVLEQELGAAASEAVPGFGTRLDLRLAMLQYPLQAGPTSELVWHVAEANALRRVRPEASSAVRGRLIAETRRWVMRDFRGGAGRRSPGPGIPRFPSGLAELLDRFGPSRIESWSDDDWEGFTLQALWRICCEGVRDVPAFAPRPPMPIRHRDLLLEASGTDTDALVHEILIRFCAAFLDQGMARWGLPGRDAGFFRAFCDLYRRPGGPPNRWLRGLSGELARLGDSGIGPLESVRESLDILGVPEADWPEFLSATLLALRGWGGMVRQVELRGDRVARPVPEGSLVGFLAVRLLLDRFAVAYTAQHALGISSPVGAFWRLARDDYDPHWPPSDEQRAFLVFQLAQIVGLSPDLLHRLTREEWTSILGEIEGFSGLERRRVFHLAYELRFRTQTLDAIALHSHRRAGRPASPAFQVACCLDEREESFRRHLEEIRPDVETFGVAGFFGVPMYYRGASDAHFVPLCPVTIRPRHRIAEEIGAGVGRSHRRRAWTRRALGTASHRFHVESRGFALGAVLAGAVGVLATFPLVARILFPRPAARIRRACGAFVRTPPDTRLRLEREGPDPGPDGVAVGFSVAEMTDMGERLLRDMGLTAGFARLVMLIGHGSNSLNNPHNSAYNCGACGGSAGGPNARAMAQILNDPGVREGLAGRGLPIPAGTLFVGGDHNTCDDSVAFSDVDRIPASHGEDFAAARRAVEAACDRNAHERCRRFMSAPLTLSFSAAREHVEGRAEDLAQTRPELGHATNAITFVGRREWTRGLFLDRRAFLASYDPTRDDAEGTILARILQAVYPVCGGINLEYFFSNVDNDGFGAGTKLPHNLAALVGVMDGAMGDLRTGLPWQMVEIHEPVRSLFVIETTPGTMLRIIEREPTIGRMSRNGWIQLAVLDPDSAELGVFREGAFVRYEPRTASLPHASSSLDWYRGWRDHLEFAEISPGTGPRDAVEIADAAPPARSRKPRR